MIESVSESINRWSLLPISMIGRINILKMSVLPKFLYLFHSIPLSPPINFFSKMKSMFCNFIWNNRRARLRLSLLYLRYDRGGLKLPNLQWYYWAAQLTTASCWFAQKTPQSWMSMERSMSSPLPLNSYLYSAKLKELKALTLNPFVKNTILVWYEVHKHKGEIPVLSRFTPIWCNRDFKPGQKDMGFKIWANKGLSIIADLFDNNTLLSFVDLKQKYGIQPNHFFKYLQIRSYIFKLQKSLSLPTLSPIEEIATNQHPKKGLTSSFYASIMEGSKVSSDRKRLAWCEDLNSVISTEDWQKICLKSQIQTINSHFKLLQYKWIMRIYVTPTQLNKFNPNNSDTCYKCGRVGTLYHCLWDCPLIQAFWSEVMDMILQVTGIKLILDPKLCILGIFPINLNLNKANKSMIIFCMLQAKYTIAKSWKSTTKPSTSVWLAGLSDSLALEKLTFTLKGKYLIFDSMWRSFMVFLEGRKALEACSPCM